MPTEKVLGSAKISSGYQVSIIREVRPFLDVKAGDRIIFKLIGETVIVEKARNRKK